MAKLNVGDKVRLTGRGFEGEFETVVSEPGTCEAAAAEEDYHHLCTDCVYSWSFDWNVTRV